MHVNIGIVIRFNEAVLAYFYLDPLISRCFKFGAGAKFRFRPWTRLTECCPLHSGTRVVACEWCGDEKHWEDFRHGACVDGIAPQLIDLRWGWYWS